MPFAARLQRILQTLLGAFSALFVVALPNAHAVTRHYGPHSGYISDTERERNMVYADMIPVQPPPSLGPSLNQRIFNDKLVREFRDRYEQKFGRTEVEQVYNSPNKFSYYNDQYGFKGTAPEMDNERRQYGDFVVRRLLEYHVDTYAQTNPRVRPVWEAKERLKEIHVEVASFRFDFQYSIAGNTFDMKLNNPYLTLSRVRLQMDPGAFGPGPVQETIVSVGRPVTRTVVLEGHYAATDGILSFIQRKQLTAAIGLSFTASTFTVSKGKSPRESKYLSGLSYTF